MPLEVLQFPHPTLRHTAKPLKKLDAQFRAWVGEMFELMYKHKGIGLAATQVDSPYRFFIVNEKGDPKTGKELVFINPVLSKPKGQAEAEEGCLSLPGLYADVRRPAQITVDAYDLAGKPIHYELDGLFARVVQHETDHLDGRLFIDRLPETSQLKTRPYIEEFLIQFDQRRREKGIPEDAEILERLKTLESERA
ncbi:MAG: peptide deformylase [Pirellulales bacterium]